MKKQCCLLLLFLQCIVLASIEGEARKQLEESFKHKTAEEIFTDIYNTNYWHGWESRSGQGSNLSTTKTIRAALPDIVHHFGIKTMVDAPCGDFNWMKSIINELSLDLYVGIDIVKPVIEQCQRTYGSSSIVFKRADLITTPLERYDLIFSRDCLAHMSYQNAMKVVKNFKSSGSTYLLTSHHIHTKKNRLITNGDHYPINLMLSPFHFPKPLFVVVERDAEVASAHQGKCLALWRLSDISIDMFDAI